MDEDKIVVKDSDIQVTVAKISRSTALTTSIISAIVVVITTTLGVMGNSIKNNGISAAQTPLPTPAATEYALLPQISPDDLLFTNDRYSIYYISGMRVNIDDCDLSAVNGQNIVSISYWYDGRPGGIDSIVSDTKPADDFTELELLNVVDGLKKKGFLFVEKENFNVVFPLADGAGDVYVPIVMFDDTFDYIGNTILRVTAK